MRSSVLQSLWMSENMSSFDLGMADMSEYDNELSKIVAELNRAAPSQKYAVARTPQSTASLASLDELLHKAAGRGASDVLLIAGAPAMLRVTGNLTPGVGSVLEAEDVRSLV